MSWRACRGVEGAGSDPVIVVARRGRGDVTFRPKGVPARDERIPLAMAVPVHGSFLRRLRAPFSSLAKAGKVWPSLLDIELPFPLEQAEYRFLNPARTADGQVEVLAVAVRREDLLARREEAVRAGLTPWRMDHEGLALWSRSVAEQPLEKQGFRLVCYLGQEHLSLVWGRGPDLLAASGLRLGLRELLDPERGVGARRQWAQRALQFVRAQPGSAGRAFQWAWCGPGAARPDQLSLLAAELKALPEVTLFTHREPESFLARALAARGVRAEATSCSLLPEEVEPPQLQRSRRARARRPALFLAAASLLLIAVNLGWGAWLGARRDTLQGLLQARGRAMSGLTVLPAGQEVLLTERAVKDQAPAYQPFAQALQPSLLLTLRETLATAHAMGLRLERLSLSEKTLVCSGSATEWTQGETLGQTLERSGWIITLDRKDAGADERIPFTLKASR